MTPRLFGHLRLVLSATTKVFFQSNNEGGKAGSGTISSGTGGHIEVMKEGVGPKGDKGDAATPSGQQLVTAIDTQLGSGQWKNKTLHKVSHHNETSITITDASVALPDTCLLYTSPSPRDRQKSRMPSSA